MKIRVKCFDIEWDTDGEEVAHLPESCEIDVDCEMEHYTEQVITDLLSDKYEWCVTSFNCKTICRIVDSLLYDELVEMCEILEATSEVDMLRLRRIIEKAKK